MRIDTVPLRPADQELDQLLARALDGRPQRRKVWAFIRGEDPRKAEPVIITVRIVVESGALLWHPVSGRTIGADRREIDVEVLRGPRVWWGPFVRRFAAARLRVELERQQLRQPELGQGDEVVRVLAGLDAHEQRMLAAAVDGDRQLRVLATFAPPRGYGEA